MEHHKTYEDALDGLRRWVRSLGDFNESSEAQKADIAFWLPRFVAEFEYHGVKMTEVEK